MGMTVADIRLRRQAERLSALQQQADLVLSEQPAGSLWLFGSWARGDWDGFSDMDLLAVAPNRVQASDLADAVLRHGMADAYWPSRSRNGRSGETGMPPTGAPSDAMPFA